MRRQRPAPETTIERRLRAQLLPFANTVLGVSLALGIARAHQIFMTLSGCDGGNVVACIVIIGFALAPIILWLHYAQAIITISLSTKRCRIELTALLTLPALSTAMAISYLPKYANGCLANAGSDLLATLIFLLVSFAFLFLALCYALLCEVSDAQNISAIQSRAWYAAVFSIAIAFAIVGVLQEQRTRETIAFSFAILILLVALFRGLRVRRGASGSS